MWIKLTARERECMFMFHLWGCVVTSSIYFHFKPPILPCRALQSPALHYRKQLFIFYTKGGNSGVAVTFLYVCNLINSECVRGSHVSILVCWSEREINRWWNKGWNTLEAALYTIKIEAFRDFITLRCYLWLTLLDIIPKHITISFAEVLLQHIGLTSSISKSHITDQEKRHKFWQKSYIHPYVKQR